MFSFEWNKEVLGRSSQYFVSIHVVCQLISHMLLVQSWYDSKQQQQQKQEKNRDVDRNWLTDWALFLNVENIAYRPVLWHWH